MIQHALRRTPVILCGLGALLLAGCSAQQGVAVSGKVIFPPSAKRQDNDTAQITFVPQETPTTGKTAGANIAADGSFVCKDVQPGKYKLVVNVTPYPGSADHAKRAAQFARLDQTYDEKHSKLVGDVTRGSQQITVDLVKGTVTKD
jgi:hypothetical protein